MDELFQNDSFHSFSFNIQEPDLTFQLFFEKQPFNFFIPLTFTSLVKVVIAHLNPKNNRNPLQLAPRQDLIFRPSKNNTAFSVSREYSHHLFHKYAILTHQKTYFIILTHYFTIHVHHIFYFSILYIKILYKNI